MKWAQRIEERSAVEALQANLLAAWGDCSLLSSALSVRASARAGVRQQQRLSAMHDEANARGSSRSRHHKPEAHSSPAEQLEEIKDSIRVYKNQN